MDGRGVRSAECWDERCNCARLSKSKVNEMMEKEVRVKTVVIT
jgi:hypothetical protein